MTIQSSRILCIDDNIEVLEMVSTALRSYRINTAQTKDEGIELAKKGGYALFIIDYYLPDGTGKQFYKHLRVFDTKTPVLFITSGDTISDRGSRSIGAEGTIRKANVEFIHHLRVRVNDLITRNFALGHSVPIMPPKPNHSVSLH